MNRRCIVWAGVLVAAMFTVGHASAADALAGKKKTALCAVCHGVDGIAKNPDAPNLAGDNANYIIKQLHAFQSGARQHEQMTIIAKGLSEEDVADLAAWYSGLKVTVEMPR